MARVIRKQSGPRQHRVGTRLSKVDVKAVAYLWAELNYSQDEIAEVLGASQSAISRALEQAENDGILKREVRLVPEEISEGEIGEILKQVSHHDVERHLKKAEPYSVWNHSRDPHRVEH